MRAKWALWQLQAGEPALAVLVAAYVRAWERLVATSRLVPGSIRILRALRLVDAHSAGCRVNAGELEPVFAGRSGDASDGLSSRAPGPT